MPHDLARRVLRNDAEPRLGARQRGLEIEVLLHAVLVGEHPPHRRGREDVAEDDGIDNGRRHFRRHDSSPRKNGRAGSNITAFK
jgi:hypothetical protein